MRILMLNNYDIYEKGQDYNQVERTLARRLCEMGVAIPYSVYLDQEAEKRALQILAERVAKEEAEALAAKETAAKEEAEAEAARKAKDALTAQANKKAVPGAERAVSKKARASQTKKT